MDQAIEPRLPISLPAFRFRESSQEILSFIQLAIQNTSLLDEGAKLLADVALAFQHRQQVPKETLAIAEALSNGSVSPLRNFLKHIPLQSELLFSRSVDNFLSYVSELLALIFATRPEMLKSEEKISIEWALQYANREEMLEALTERKIIQLSFQGMVDLHEDLDKKYGFKLYPDSENLQRASIAIEKRNLVAHNRGIVNRRYLSRVKSSQEPLGSRLAFEPNGVVQDVIFLTTTVLDIDRRAAEQFGVPQSETAPAWSGLNQALDLDRLVASLGK